MGKRKDCIPLLWLEFALTLLPPVMGQCSLSGISLIGSSGNFSSPYYPSNYQNNETCRLIITVPQGNLVRLSFQFFQLESCFFSSPTCSCDHLEVRDGIDSNAELLGRYCGNEYPTALLSSGRFMWIEFHADSSDNERGFLAKYIAVDESKCPRNGILSGANGSFTSPGYPLTYPVSVTCTWIIEVPVNYHVQLTFTTFQLENCAIPSLCTCDHVEVRDGQSTSSPKLKELCGDITPSPLRSSGRHLWVEFESDSKTARNGFAAFFKAVHDSECPKNSILRGTNGSFTSPGFPLTYPDSVTCTWIIEVPENYHVELTFGTFQLENCIIPSLCTCDHVEVRDGQSASSPKLKKLCGDITPSLIRSSGRYLWVEFETDSKTIRNGFDAFFKAVPTSECPNNDVLRGANGSFTSPGFPSSYPDSVTCTWIIEVPENYHVELTFPTFQLENCAIPSLCTCDHVQVRDGQSASSSELKELCGDQTPSPLRSTGRYLWVEFKSDSKTVGNGFRAFFEAVHVNECPANRVLRGTNGSFTSPRFPSTYPVSVTCTWIIEVPENYHVELTFNTFQLENCIIPSLCTCDHVEVRDGQSASSPELETFCGDNKPILLRSTGRYLWVEFYSDSRTVGNGFNAAFKAVLNRCPKDGAVSGSSGSLTSPGFPTSYPNDVTCSWIIEVPENHFVQLTFETFEVETCIISPSLCLCDHVEVGDGKTASSPNLKKLCGDKTPSPLYSSGRYMWVEFKSDSKTTRKGFNATFEAGEFVFFCEAWFGWSFSKVSCIGMTSGLLGVTGVITITLSCWCCRKRDHFICSVNICNCCN